MRSRQIFAALMLLSGCYGDREEDVPAELSATNTCYVRSTGTSEWAHGMGDFNLDTEFGRDDGGALADVWGLATTPGGSVIAFDAGNTRVIHLDENLELIRSVGRSGRGPGEFVYQRAVHGDWVTATDSAYYVLDYRALSEFDLAGKFKRYMTRDLPNPIPIRQIGLLRGQVLYAADLVDGRTGERVLETWAIESAAPHRLVRRDSMPPLPRWRGRFVRGIFADQAEPLWAQAGPCAFISDGGSDWLLRVDLRSGRADTIPLPPRVLPVRTEADELRMERIRAAAGLVGITTGTGAVEPTVRTKYTGMVIDPDGFVWLRPWRPYSHGAASLYALVLHPASGSVDSVRVPDFPDAFLPDGSFVSLHFDQGLMAPLIRKYVPSARRKNQ